MLTDELLREADPVRATEIPRPDSLEGRRIKAHAFEIPAPQSTISRIERLPRRAAWPLGVLGTVAAAVVVLVALLPAGIGPTPSAAAALNELATTAGNQPGLAPGHYEYSEVETQPLGSSGVTIERASFTEYTAAIVQTWVAADGSGREVTSEDLNPYFATPADKSLWERTGGKYQEPPRYRVSTVVFGPGGVDISGERIPENRQPPIDVSSLPTNPQKLAKALCTARWHSLLDFGSGLGPGPLDLAGSSAQCPLFSIALVVLQGSIAGSLIIGSSPQLREALFHVLAKVPGVRLLGVQDDGAGTKGIALRLTEHQRATSYTASCPAIPIPPNSPIPAKVVDVHVPATTTIDTVIVDQASARLLSRGQTFLPLKVPASVALPCAPPATNMPPQILEYPPVRTIVLSAGIVNSTHSVAEGSVAICASKKRSAHPSHVCRGARDDRYR